MKLSELIVHHIELMHCFFSSRRLKISKGIKRYNTLVPNSYDDLFCDGTGGGAGVYVTIFHDFAVLSSVFKMEA